MTREEAIKLAEQAGWKGPKDNVTFVAILQAYANLVAAAEREACAVIANEYHGVVADVIYDRITARGQG
jgi:hypothetical protein